MSTSTPFYDQRLQRHIDAYRIWCHKQGLDKSFDKSDGQLQQELELFKGLEKTRRPAPKPDYRPHTVRIITALYEGKSRTNEMLAQKFDATADGDERKVLWRRFSG